MSVERWHVLLLDVNMAADGSPIADWLPHICAAHRTVGLALPPCPDREPDGTCRHVRLVPCSCEPPGACDACANVPSNPASRRN